MKRNESIQLSAIRGCMMLIIVYCCAHAAVLGKTYTSANRFITVMADDAGYLWAGTENDGLLRLNKNTGETAVFTSGNSGLVDNGIQALAFDGQDRLIVGTAWQGVVRFDGTRWERLPGLPAAGVRGVAVDSQGTMWACTNAGVVRLKGGAWETVINRVSGGIAADGKGGIWICNTPVCNSEACAGGGIYEYVNGGLQSTIALSSVWSEMTSLNAFAVDMKRNAWIGTRRELMQISDFTANRYVVSSDTMSPKSVAALAVDRSDRVMIALTTYPDTSEIFIYDPVNKTGQPLDSVVKTYGNLTVTAACAHLQGGFWLGASNGTIIKLDEFNRDTMYSAGNSSIPGNTISSLIIDDRNCVWAKTDRGIAKFDNTTWTVYPTSGDSFPGQSVSALAMDSSGTVWAGFQQSPISSFSQCGLSYFNGQQWRVQERGHISVRAIAFDGKNDCWVVYEDGVYRFHGAQKERLFETIASSDKTIAMGTTVYAIAFDNNNIPSIGTGLGVKKFENGNWIVDSAIIRKSGAQIINVIVFDQLNRAWIGTNRGLFKCTGDSCTLFDTTGSFLPDAIVQCVAVDSQNTVWIGTKQGLVCFNGANRCTYTTSNTSLLSNDIASVAVDGAGNIWAGTRAGGLTVFKRNELLIQAATAVAQKCLFPRQSSLNISCRFAAPRSYCFSLAGSRPQRARLTITSINGELVRRIDASSSQTGIARLQWDGMNQFNRPVPAGVYIGRVTLDGKIIHSRPLLCR